MRTLWHDFRYAFRQLRKSPGFSLTVVATLALGIGATTAIFSLVEGVLLRPLPFRDPDRLVVLGDHIGNSRNLGVTAREISTYARTTSTFTSVGGYSGADYELSGGETPRQIAAARLTAEVFPTLGVSPILGRVFTPEEETARQPLVVISYALWLERYQRDPHVLGRDIYLDRKAYTIVGVMPRSFEFPLRTGHLDQVQLWVPLGLTPDELSEANAGSWGFALIARLKNGVDLTQAAQDADRVARQVMRDFPANMAAIRIQGDARLLREATVSNTRPLLRMLFLAVTVVLLLACVNVAGLLLVRAMQRRREYAVRMALGARTSAILAGSIYEGILLSLGGGLLGLGLAAAAIRMTLHLLPESMLLIDSVSMDWGVVAFALLVAFATGVLCGSVPAFAALRTNIVASLKDGARSGTGSASHGWLRSTLVVVEIAVALMLVTAAGAFVRSFAKMRSVDPGFSPAHVLVARYQLPVNHYATHAAVTAFDEAVVNRLSAQPGMVSVGLGNSLPGSASWGAAAYTVEGEPASTWHLQFAPFATVDGKYFQALGISLLDGRRFEDDDRADSVPVVMVNRSMAQHLWPGQRAIGKRIHVGNPQKPYPWATVVGIVADTRLGGRDEPSGDQWYIPSRQPATLFGPNEPLSMASGGYIVMRSALPPEQMEGALRSAVAAVDPLLALEDVQTMEDVISNAEAPRRFNTGLIMTFALSGLLLAVTGIYAVVAFSVSLRTQEIGIRMALGAQRSEIARMVLASAARLALVGCALGVAGSLAASRMLSALLFEVSSRDPWIYLGGALVMVLAALAASALPARRAASADPLEAIRAS